MGGRDSIGLRSRKLLCLEVLVAPEPQVVERKQLTVAVVDILARHNQLVEEPLVGSLVEERLCYIVESTFSCNFKKLIIIHFIIIAYKP